MLRVDLSAHRLVPSAHATLTAAQILERQDLEEMIVNSWEDFANELGYPDLRLVRHEQNPHERSSQNRVDILALDENPADPDERNKLVVIELKRGRDKLQLLQALSYAAMVRTWTSEDFERVAAGDEDLLAALEALPDEHSPRVVLVAETFDPEVVLTANWLYSLHGVDIQCFSVQLHQFGEDLELGIRRDFPLRGLDEVYRSRRRRPRTASRRSWGEIRTDLNYEWGKRLIDLCLVEKEGEPDRKRFGAMFPNQWGSYYLTFHRDAVSVVVYNRRDGDMAHWGSTVPGAAVKEWGDETTRSRGLRFKLTNEAQVEAFLGDVGRTLPD